MPGAMRCSRSSALLGKTILTRRTSMQHPKPELRYRPDLMSAAGQAAMQQLQHGFAMAQSQCVPEHPFSRAINRQFFRMLAWYTTSDCGGFPLVAATRPWSPQIATVFELVC